MTRAEKIHKVRALRADDWTAKQIGLRVGATESTVRNWYLGGDCSDCGAPLDGSSLVKRSRRCDPCQRSLKTARNEEIARRHTEGEPHWLIAQEMATTASVVATQIDRMRRIKGREIPLHRLGGNLAERDRRRLQMISWRREGLSNGEIAERLGTSAQSVSFMLTTARRLGFEVPVARWGRRQKLTPADVAEIRASAETNRTLAERLDVSATTVSRVRNGQIYAAVGR